MTPISSTGSLLALSTCPVPKAGPWFWWRCRLPTAEAGRAQGASCSGVRDDTEYKVASLHATLRAGLTMSCPLQRYDLIRGCMTRWLGMPSIDTSHGRWQLAHQLASAEKAVVLAASLQVAWWSARELLLIPYLPPCALHWDKLKDDGPVYHPLAH